MNFHQSRVEKRAGSGHPGLNFIKDQKRSMLLATFLDLTQAIQWDFLHSPHTLDRFDQYGCRFPRNSLSHRACRQDPMHGHRGVQVVGIFGDSRAGETAVGAAVKRVGDGDDFLAPGDGSGQLEGIFIGFAAGVGPGKPGSRAHRPSPGVFSPPVLGLSCN